MKNRLKITFFLKGFCIFFFLIVSISQIFIKDIRASSPYLAEVVNCSIDGEAPYSQIPGVGSNSKGAGMALADIDNNGKTDVIMMACVERSDGFNFIYRIGYDLDLASGNPSRYSIYSLRTAAPRLLNQRDIEGAGVAIADIDGNGNPDIVLMAYYSLENRNLPNVFVYKIGYNLNQEGRVSHFGTTIEVTGFVGQSAGAGIAIGDIDRNNNLDIVLCAYIGEDDKHFRYKVGSELRSDGRTPEWRNGLTGGMGMLAQGADVSLCDIDLDGNLDIVLMAYDNPYWNNFRYKIGWNLGVSGAVRDWSRWYMLKGVGTEGGGAGLAYYGNSQSGPLLFFMAYNDPNNNGTFRYYIRPVTTSGATFGTAIDYPPRVNNLLRVPSGSSDQSGTKLFNLNMSEVQQTAQDALAYYVFTCFFVEIFDELPSCPVCWYNHPDNDINYIKIFANQNFDTSICPDMLVAAVAFYVDGHMGWVNDEANGYVLNTIHDLDYGPGGDAIPAYYTIRYTDPTRHSNLITDLQAENADWANAYNDGNIYHGDCEDFAILRHSLLRALGFDRNYIWNVSNYNHEFNIVAYKGSYHLMDYGHIYRYSCRPSGITSVILGAWNQANGPRYSDNRDIFYTYILNHGYPDRCENGLGWVYTQRAHPDRANTTGCCY